MIQSSQKKKIEISFSQAFFILKCNTEVLSLSPETGRGTEIVEPETINLVKAAKHAYDLVNLVALLTKDVIMR